MISCNAVVSTRPKDCKDFSFYECQDTTYYWYTEPQQIQSSNDLMLLYNDSFRRFYQPPSEYTVLGLFVNDCVLSEDYTDDYLYPNLEGDPFKDSVTDAYKTYSVASVKSDVMESLTNTSCEYDVSRRANNDDNVSASLASTAVALSLCLATLLFLM